MELVRLIEETAQEKQVRTLRMASGALHDSSILPEVTEVGMIFIPSKAGRSRCPEEDTDLKDLRTGAEILLGAVVRLAS